MPEKWKRLICISMVISLASVLGFLPQLASASTLDTSLSSFNIMAVPQLGGADQYETAAKIAEQGWPETTGAVVLSAGMIPNLVDALAAGPLSARLKAPLLLTDGGNQLNVWTKQELQRLKPVKAFITSGTAVIKPSVLNELEDMGITPVELGGFDQYETSVNIAQELIKQGVQVSQIVVAAGWSTPADALSVAAIAATQGMPILATTRDALPSSVKSFLDSLSGIADSYVIGGTAVVGSTIQDQLPGVKHRYAGLTKYDTNIEVLEGFMDVLHNGKTYVANGETFVDALAGVPLAAQSYSAILLTDQTLPELSCEYAKLNLSPDLVVLGGQAVVSQKVIEQITSAQVVSAAGTVLGSADAASPQVIEEGLRVTGNQVTLENLKVNNSVFSQGNVLTLNHVVIGGTLFLDPGSNGIINLDNVIAKNIVVLSGDQSNVNLNNVLATTLKVASSAQVKVQTTGSTMITHTVVGSAATLDVTSGSVGTVAIANASYDSSGVVELRGSFQQPIVVSEGVTLRGAPGSYISKLQISPNHKGNKIILDGLFNLVEVNKEAVLNLADNTVITKVVTYATAYLTVPSTAQIVELITQNTGTVASGGGLVNGSVTPAQPVVIPPSDNGGGGGGGGVVDPPVSSTINVRRIEVITSPACDLAGSGNMVTVDMHGLPGETRVIGFMITVDQSCDLQLDGVDNSIHLSAGDDTLVKLEDMIPETHSGNGVSLKTLRAYLGNTVTVQGVLKQNGSVVESIAVTLNM
ncbi:MAG: cell wall-binding repeat-containing protein [Desulfitobacteriaceae bacterium]